MFVFVKLLSFNEKLAHGKSRSSGFNTTAKQKVKFTFHLNPNSIDLQVNGPFQSNLKQKQAKSLTLQSAGFCLLPF